MHSNFGFEPRNAMVVDTDLNMAGYTGDQALPVNALLVFFQKQVKRALLS